MATLPTLEELNQLPVEQVMLLMHRILNTSDLTFHYALYSSQTVANLALGTKALLHYSGMAGLNAAEQMELAGYLHGYEPFILGGH